MFTWLKEYFIFTSKEELMVKNAELERKLQHSEYVRGVVEGMLKQERERNVELVAENKRLQDEYNDIYRDAMGYLVD